MSGYRSSLRDRSPFGILPDDLYVAPSPGRASAVPSNAISRRGRVMDDWPARVPVTDAEIDVFEAWFGDLFDELFGPRR